MSDNGPKRIADPAVSELDVGGRLVYRLEQQKESDLSELETAAMVASLRSFADALERTNLDRPAEEILEETGHTFSLHDDDPENVR